VWQAQVKPGIMRRTWSAIAGESKKGLKSSRMRYGLAVVGGVGWWAVRAAHQTQQQQQCQECMTYACSMCELQLQLIDSQNEQATWPHGVAQQQTQLA
jgi:hypothetical protein